MALALTDLRIWDGSSEALSDEGWTLRVEDGRIAALGPGRELAAGARVISLPGQTAVPGLIAGLKAGQCLIDI